jgi:hypothetical protein
MDDLKAHAAGFLSPLIEEIHVGWPSDVLKAGVTLVDLPGAGLQMTLIAPSLADTSVKKHAR